MSSKFKQEVATVSFHYLTREVKQEDGSTQETPFSNEDFTKIVEKLENFRKIDITDDADLNLLRYKKIAPINKVTKINERTIFGVFQSSYWGHAYFNTKKGKIDADSINLRDFHFLLYLSDSGKIYVAAQYLGQFGGYTGLKNTLINLIPDHKNVYAHSLRLDYANIAGMNPKEVRVSLSRKPDNIDDDNIFSRSGMYVFKKQSKNDGFEQEVSKSFLSLMPFGREQKKHKIAELLKSTQMIDAKDADIQDCSVIVSVNGSRKVVHLFEGSEFATKIIINVDYNLDGIPKYEDTKNEIIRILKEQIIPSKENV